MSFHIVGLPLGGPTCFGHGHRIGFIGRSSSSFHSMTVVFPKVSFYLGRYFQESMFFLGHSYFYFSSQPLEVVFSDINFHLRKSFHDSIFLPELSSSHVAAFTKLMSFQNVNTAKE
uniref:Uncharacterized protein n=1 Tax=Cacopsylla melanoneura TaxID=428564 RepID=A0A8D8QZQ2_9HEMI